MSDEAVIREIWPDWQLLEPLDSGSFGTVFRARHREHPELFSAVKIIEIPQDEDQILALREEGRTEEQIARYLAGIAERYASEIRRMDLLKGMSHIVSIEDTKTIPHADSPGCTVCIRMELLKTLKEYTADKHLGEEEVIRMGIDLCEALELCHRNAILHLDVKPDNIFVNDRMRSEVLWKLGDFGASRELLQTQDESILQGTILYMAPEVSRREKADGRADIYSLGLTLFRLMNGDRLPFLQKNQFPSHNDLSDAARMRLSGIPVPDPEEASSTFSAVIRKACAYSPEDRFRDAAEMKEALQVLLRAREKKTGKGPRSKRVRIACLIVLFLLAGALLAWLIRAPQPEASSAGDPSPEPTRAPMIVVEDHGAGELLRRMRECGMLGGSVPVRIPRSLETLGGTPFFLACAPALRYADADHIEYAENDSPEWTLQVVFADGFTRNPERDGMGRFDLSPGERGRIADRESIWISAVLPLPDQPSLQFFYDPQTLALTRAMMTVRGTLGSYVLTNMVAWPGREKAYEILFLTESAIPVELWYNTSGVLCEITWRGETVRQDDGTGADFPPTIEGAEWV